MDSIFKICITGKVSDFAVRPLLSASGPFEDNKSKKKKKKKEKKKRMPNAETGVLNENIISC